MRWRGLEVAVAATTLAAAFGVAFVRSVRIAAERPDWYGEMARYGCRARPLEEEAFVGPLRPSLSGPCFELDDRDLYSDFGVSDPDLLALPWQSARDRDLHAGASDGYSAPASDICVVAAPSAGPHARQAPWRSHGIHDHGVTATRSRGTSASRPSSPSRR